MKPSPVRHFAPVPSQFHLGYRPSLDGLRGVAVLAVLGFHNYVPYFGGGNLGVDIFFVLSGFLITSLMLEEWQRTGTISFRNFYLRRALRLLPALFAFLLLLELYTALVLRGADFWQMQKSMLAVLAYAANWVKAFGVLDLRALNHMWSLSVEEQFYFLWPALLALMLRGRRSPGWIFPALAAAIVVIALRRAAFLGSVSSDRIYHGTDTRFDELLTGCLLAIGLCFGRLRAFRALPFLVLPSVALNLWWIARAPGVPRLALYGWVLIETSVAVVILYLVTRSRTLLHRLLELPWLVWVGRISYGLYLWHAPIGTKVGGWALPQPLRIVLSFALSLAVAGASYRWIERPFLRKKSRLQNLPDAAGSSPQEPAQQTVPGAA